MHLTKLSKSDDCELTKEVANIILDEGQDDLMAYMNGLLSHGCVSGWVTALTWYNQTHAFYDRQYEAIEELRDNHELEIGQPLVVQGDLKNFYAWFAFELTAYRIACEVGW